MVFKTKARTVDAMRLEASTWSYMVAFAGKAMRGIQLEDGTLAAIVDIPGGAQLARSGDWIVKTWDGKLSIVKDDTFRETYEPIGNSAVAGGAAGGGF